MPLGNQTLARHLKAVAGSKPIFTSADAPGIIYDLLYVSPESLATRRDDWLKVTKVWYRIVEYMANEDNWDEALKILAKRVNLTPEEYEPLLAGTRILSMEQALMAWKKGEGLDSVYGSSMNVDAFNLKYGAYGDDGKAQDISSYLDPSLTKEIAP